MSSFQPIIWMDSVDVSSARFQENLAAPYLDMEVHNPIPAPHLSKVRNQPVTQPDFSPLHVFTTEPKPGFLSLNPIDIWGQIILRWGVLCCALGDVEQCLWPQATRYRNPSTVMTISNVSRQHQGRNHAQWRITDGLWNTRFQKQNKTKQKYWFSNLTVQETSGDIVKNVSPWACDSKGIWSIRLRRSLGICILSWCRGLWFTSKKYCTCSCPRYTLSPRTQEITQGCCL